MNKDEPIPASTPPSWKVHKWFPDLPVETQKNLKIYWEELLKFNKTVNLISPKTMAHADTIHFGDSIRASQIVYKNSNDIKELIDIGSGNGFPGLVFGLLYPNIKVVLVDVDQRKCEFLKHVIAKTGSKNVSVDNGSIERYDGASIKFAITRGFASIPKALLMLRKSIQMGGAIYFLKSEEWSQEVLTIPTQLCSIWSPELIGEYSPPELSAKFFVVKANKISTGMDNINI